jgi:hypothetical protein
MLLVILRLRLYIAQSAQVRFTLPLIDISVIDRLFQSLLSFNHRYLLEPLEREGLYHDCQ